MKYPESIESWESRVSKMVKEIRNGWSPKPLIATNYWEEYYTIADGNHRQEALLRCGINLFPTVFYFKTQKDMQDFIKINHKK